MVANVFGISEVLRNEVEQKFGERSEPDIPCYMTEPMASQRNRRFLQSYGERKVYGRSSFGGSFAIQYYSFPFYFISHFEYQSSCR